MISTKVVAFLVGFFIGGLIGFFIAALMNASAELEEEEKD